MMAIRLGLGSQTGETALEIVPPLGRHSGRIPEILLVHDLSEARVGGLENVGIHGITTAFQLEDRGLPER
jgi:hypothetical protein